MKKDTIFLSWCSEQFSHFGRDHFYISSEISANGGTVEESNPDENITKQTIWFENNDSGFKTSFDIKPLSPERLRKIADMLEAQQIKAKEILIRLKEEKIRC
jgi:hypothetical protein